MEKQVLSGMKQTRSNRILLEEISNYIPDSYSMILKRNGDQNQQMNENNNSNLNINAQGYQLSSYYDKVALSSEKKKQKALEDGEIDGGSARKKNKIEKKKLGKDGIVEVSKQLVLTNKVCNQMENHNNSNNSNTNSIISTQSGPVNYGEYLKEKQSKKDQKYEEKLEKKQLNILQDISKNEQETKKEYVNEPFPQILQAHEQLMLLKVWRQRNFMDFNTWVQKSGASLKITYQSDQQEMMMTQRLSKKKAIIEGTAGIDKLQKKQLFHCFIELRVDVLEKTIQLSAASFSENKKDSKKRAFEGLFKEIANRNLLWLGIKYKSYLDYIMAFDEVPNSAGGFHSAIRQNEPALFDSVKDQISLQEFQQAKMHKLSKKMQFCIAKDMFDEACKELVKMAETNIGLEWRWVSFLWSYCLRRKRVSELKYLLDVMQYGNVKREESEEQYCELVKSRFHCIPALSDDTPQEEANRQSVRRSLRMQYRDVVRLESTNIFDSYDPFNLELITDEQLPTHNGGIDVPEPIPRIFHENIETNLSKTSATILKTTKPLYNYFSQLPFSGSQSQQQTQLQLNSKSNSQQYLMQHNNYYAPKRNNPNNSAAAIANNLLNVSQQMQFKQTQEAFTNYLSLDMINSMYDTLVYSAADTQFALQAAEVVYKYAKVNPEQFISPVAAQYFLNRKVQLIQETIEAVSNSLYTCKSPQAMSYQNAAAYFTNIKGSITQVGTVFEKDVYLFYPIENAAVLEKKLLKRNQIDGSQYHHQICEDDVVVLSCFFKPTYDKPFMKSIGIKLVDHFNEKGRKKEEAKPIDKNNNIIAYNKQQFEEPTITEANSNSTFNKAYVDSITEYGNKIEYAVVAQVKEIQKDLGIKLYILNPEKQLLEDAANKSWKITKLCHIGSFEKHTESLQRATTKEEAMTSNLNKILTAAPMTNPLYLRSLAETVVEQEKQIKNNDLNRQQQEAVLAGHKQCLTLIQAPNGSGKMRVVKRLISMWQSLNNKQKVLLCVHSLGRMRQVFCSLKASNVNVIEVSEKQTTKIEFTGLKTSIPEYEKTNNSMPRYYHSLKKALLGSHVVITNCSSANYSVLKGLFFNKVIILDAENINETVCLEALTKQCQQLILIGDPQQQTEVSNSSFASSRGYNVSLFERLVRQGIRPFLLLQNYKVQLNAVQFLSKFFYKNLMFTTARSKNTIKRQIPTIASDSYQHYQYPLHGLDSDFDCNFGIVNSVCSSITRTDISTLINNTNNTYSYCTDIDNYVWPNPQIRINFINVEGYELLTSESIINVKDAEVSIHVILYLFKSKTIHKDQFCIVTPYASQKQLIITELDYHIKNNPNLFNMDEQEVLNIKSATDIINVKTIEEIDSRYDFILFSTVRSNKEGKMGSLRDPRKLNSVISKANEALVVIGDAYTLDSEYIWREFIIWCKENGLIYQYSN